MTTTKIANLSGKNLEMRRASDYIQWAVEDSGLWENLVPLGDLQGIPGLDAVPTDEGIATLVGTAGTSATKTALEVRYGTTMHAPQYGVVGDGTTNDTAALQALLNSASSFGASVTMEQNTTVLLASTIAVPTGTRLFLNGATLKAAAANTTVMMTFTGKSNILISGGTIDGDKAAYAPPTEWRHALSLDNSHNVTLRDLTVKNAKGDGVYVGGTIACTNITLENVNCIGNHRQGMSVVAVSGLEATNCRFIGTTGTNPQAGVDIEPNSGSVVCEDIKFTSCTFSGNGHFGFVVAFAFTVGATARQGGIELIGCTISGNGVAPDTLGGGLNLRAAIDFTMTGGTIIGNNGPGVLIDWSVGSKNINICSVNIVGNSTHGVSLTRSVVNMSITGSTIRDNGTKAAATYDGIDLSPAAASSSIRLIGNVVTGASQRYGVRTGSNVSGLVSIGNDYAGNGTAPFSLSDDSASRTQMDGASGVHLSARQMIYSAAAATMLSLRQVGDTGDRLSGLTDGRLMWGTGSGSADVQLSRVAVGVLGTGAGHAFRTGVGATASRPSAATVGAGSQFYDSTLGKPIWSNGSVWKDAMGTTV